MFEDADPLRYAWRQTMQTGCYLTENGFEAQTVNEVMEAKDASGETIGYALNMTTSEAMAVTSVFPWV